MYTWFLAVCSVWSEPNSHCSKGTGSSQQSGLGKSENTMKLYITTLDKQVKYIQTMNFDLHVAVSRAQHPRGTEGSNHMD